MKRLKNSTKPRTVAPVVDEVLFARMLSLERRRCERTGDPFALMLIDVEELSRTFGAAQIEELASAISNAMRETDITGWYQTRSRIGVILTTLNGADRATLESVVGERTKAVLANNLEAGEMNRVQISFLIFPEQNDISLYSGYQNKDLHSHLTAAVKRSIDITGSLFALLILSPLFAAIAAAIKLTSDGPIFFRQKRLGQFGREFTFLKFRSMRVNNDSTIHQEYVRALIQNKAAGSGGSFKIQNDPRVTRVGKFLRKSSLDELPQFLNVLFGEMSLVGPRPPIPYEFASYSLWHRRRVLEAKPGITGDWQVHGRSRTTFDDMVRMDLRYIQNQSIWLDLKLLIKTPLAVLTGNGAH